MDIKLKKELRNTTLELLILLCLPFIIGAVNEYLNCHFSHFDAEKTSLMEEIFDITVDDNIKLKRYIRDGNLVYMNEKLELETDSYERFITENVNASLELDESLRNEERLIYKYTNKKTDMEIKALKKENYLITLRHWE